MAPEVQVAAEMPESVGFWRTVLTKPVMSWALYDLANTIFSMNIVSLYLALWVIDMGGTDATWGYVNSVTMVLVFVSAPVLGALSDQAGRRLPFLLVFTLVCVGFTAALGTGGLMMTLVLFVIASSPPGTPPSPEDADPSADDPARCGACGCGSAGWGDVGRTPSRSPS